MKKTWIIANWKSNKNIAEALEWVNKVGPKIPSDPNLKVVLCPQFDALEEIKKVIQVGGFALMLGAQDLSPFSEGAYTGEESAHSLSDTVEMAILGHSERRQNFGETDELIAQKVKQAVENKIIPLVCVQNENTPVPEGCQLVAYEPIFAIGTGNADTPEDATKVSAVFKERYPTVEVLYGGSVHRDNAADFVRQENVSGLLIGKASLDAEEFLAIVESVKNI